MHDLLRRLPAGSQVLDLGAGTGSFDYGRYPALAFTAVEPYVSPDSPEAVAQVARNPHTRFLQQPATDLFGVDDASIDGVIANNTFEHFADLVGVFSELRRVLRPRAALYAALPDGYGLDDGLYRWLFDGGGHVNRFTPDRFVAVVEAELPGMALTDLVDLNTGCTYLRDPAPEALVHFPRRARRVVAHPRLARTVARTLPVVAEAVDVAAGSHLHRYGIMAYFERGAAPDAEPLRFDRSRLSRWTCPGCGGAVEPPRVAGVVRCGCGAQLPAFRSEGLHRARRRMARALLGRNGATAG